MRKRIFSILAALAVLCGSVLALPVSAAQPNTSRFWNWEDLISESIITGDTKTTTVIFPNVLNSPPYPSWRRFTYSWGSLVNYSVIDPADMSIKITWPLDADGAPAAPLDNGVRLIYEPFGYVAYGVQNPGMYVENVPNGTELSFSMSITYGLGSVAELFAEDITLKVHYMSFVDNQHVTTLSSTTFKFDVDDAIYDPAYMVTLPFSFVLDKPDTCNTISIEINLGVLKYYPGDVNSNVLTVAPSPLVMTFETSVMAELLDKIDSGNQTMDKIYDAINQPADPVAPSGSGAVDDLIDQEDQLMQGVTGGQAQVGDVQNNAAAGLTSYASGFAFLAGTVNYFYQELPWLQYLLYIALSLGTVAVLLGIVPTIFRDRDHDSNRPLDGQLSFFDRNKS